MPQPTQFSRICWAIAGAAVVPVLWGMGWVGGGKYDEHVAMWRIVVSGLDGDGLRVHDGITVDFGNERRSGMDRVIDNGFGAPEKVYGRPWVIAPDQPAPGPGAEIMFTPSEQSLDVTEETTVAHLRTERARSTGVEYVTAHYDLPNAPNIGEQFEYELIPGGRAVDTDDVYVYLNAMTLESAFCRRGSGVDCELQTADGYYAIELSSLPAGDSLTIGGTVTGWTDWVDLPEPEFVEPRVEPSGERWVQWILALPMAAVGWHLAALRWRRRGASLWSRPAAPDAVVGDAATGLVGLPTLSSWTASPLVHQEIGLPAAAAWFAEQVANGVLTVEIVKGSCILRRGPQFDQAGLGMRDEPVYVVGLELTNPTCRLGSGKPCDVTKVNNHYELHVASFDANDSLTIGGTLDRVIASVDDVTDLEFAESRRQVADASVWWGALSVSLLALLIGRSVASGVRKARRDGRRRALAGESPSDEAPAHLPAIEPWMATALWHERVDLRSVRTWLAQQVAADVLRVEGENNSRFVRGDRLALADLDMADEFERLVGPDGVAPIAPSSRISRMLRRAARRQRAALPVSRWWLRFGPGSGHWFSRQLFAVLLAWAGTIALLIVTDVARPWVVMIALLIAVPASVAAATNWWLAPRPTPEGEEAAGELLPLHAFFQAVSVPDVEQLWRDGRLTEFCVWAVAMGAADHWYDTVNASGIPRDERFALTAPLALGRTSGSWILTSA